MGYQTEFEGHVTISPPLNVEEIEFLKKFADSRRMKRTGGPYFVDGEGFMGQGDGTDTVLDHNNPPEGQPGLWCKWEPSSDGHCIEWNEAEKFYDAEKWMKYLIKHFLQPGALAKDTLPFLQANHTVNGVIEAQGEDKDDRWDLVVRDNRVFVVNYTRVKGDEMEVEITDAEKW